MTCGTRAPPCAPMALCLTPLGLRRAPPSLALVLLAGACAHHLACRTLPVREQSKEGEGRKEGLIAKFMPCCLLTLHANVRSKSQVKGYGPAVDHLKSLWTWKLNLRAKRRGMDQR
jgi:hypothetical protein